MTTIEASVVINRPVEEIFAFVADPNNTVQWAGPVIEAEKTSEGPVGLGTTSTRVTQFLGRTMEATYEITEYEVNRYYADKMTSGPMPIGGRISFEPTNEGTKVTVAGDIEAAGFYKLAEPLIARMAKRQVATDVQTLKDLLEAQA
jgi:uncharacterized protein YndB with AHSA1/START domain